jgi:hypothetical protein
VTATTRVANHIEFCLFEMDNSLPDQSELGWSGVRGLSTSWDILLDLVGGVIGLLLWLRLVPCGGLIDRDERWQKRRIKNGAWDLGGVEYLDGRDQLV